MAEEKIVTFNLRKIVVKKSRFKRANYAIRYLKNYLAKHFAPNVKISQRLANQIFKNPMKKVRVKIKKEENRVEVDLQ